MKVLTEQEYSSLVDEIILSQWTKHEPELLYYKLLSSKYQFYKYPYRISYLYYITFEGPSPYRGYTKYYHFWLKVDPTRHDGKIQFYVFDEHEPIDPDYVITDSKFIDRRFSRYIHKDILQIIKRHLSKKKFQRLC